MVDSRTTDPSPAGRLARGVVAALRDAAELALPLTCAGCGAAGVVLCDACAGLWEGPARRCEEAAPRLDHLDAAGPLPVWALAPNAGPAREVVVSWKDRGRADVSPALRAALGRVGGALAAGPPGQSGPAGVLVVPAPASPAGRRRRGEDLVAQLAEGLADGLRAAAVPARVAVALHRARGGPDQKSLGARARARNLSGRVRVRPAAAPDLHGSRVLLVDDVLTTGATLAACERALRAAGAQVTGAVVLVATAPPGRTASWLVPSPDGS